MIPLKDDNPRTGWPVVNFIIIGLNIVVFIYQFTLPQTQAEHFILKYAAIPSSIMQGYQLHTLFTSMFLHGGIAHILFNMLYLYIFGDNVENSMGSGRYVAFYLICGVGAATAHILSNPHSNLPMLGASGAISGVMGAYAVLFPRARVLVLVPIFFFITTVRIPALLLLLIWFLIQLSSGLASFGLESGGGVAWFAHIGGFLIGVALIKVFAKKPETKDWTDYGAY